MRVKLNELRSIILEALLNAYDVLGLKPGASEDEIKQAWKMLAIKNHPDRGGSHGAMVDINKAKERLLDPTELGKRGPIFPGYETAGAQATPAAPKAAPTPPPAAAPPPPRTKRPSPDADEGQYTRNRSAKHATDQRQVVGKARCPFCGSYVNTVMDKDWGEVYANHIDMASYMKNMCSGNGNRVEARYKVKEVPKKAAPPPPPPSSAKSKASPPPPPAAEPAAGKGRGDKDSYKVYPYAGQRRVMRIKGKLYGTGEGGRLPDGGVTKFNAHDRANVKRDGERIKVTNPDTGHSQTWDPIEEVRTVVDDIIIEMLTKIGERK